jgi:hypothetical protein
MPNPRANSITAFTVSATTMRLSASASAPAPDNAVTWNIATISPTRRNNRQRPASALISAGNSQSAATAATIAIAARIATWRPMLWPRAPNCEYQTTPATTARLSTARSRSVTSDIRMTRSGTPRP